MAGCPWDLEQSFETIVPYTIEEAYEVADAIENGDMERLQDELGDLLFQVVFYAQMAGESGGFDSGDVVAGVSDKMIRRHPHVFGDTDVADADTQTIAWESPQGKGARRVAPMPKDARPVFSMMSHADYPPCCGRISSKNAQPVSASTGLKWRMSKVRSTKRLPNSVKLSRRQNRVRKAGAETPLPRSLAMFCFHSMNYARHLGVEPETAMRDANAKFERRFRDVESEMTAAGRDLRRVSLSEYDKAWERAKARERNPQSRIHENSSQVEEAQ